MHKIIFKGDVSDEFVDDDSGVQIAVRWEKGTLPSKVEINGNLYESSAIKAILKGFSAPNMGYSEEQFQEKVRADREKYEKERLSRIKMSPEERAKDVSSANLIYVSFHGERMPEEIEAEVIKRQTEYYKKNPTHSLARPTCYRDLMGKPITPPTNRPPKIGEKLPLTAMKFTERIFGHSLNEK